MKYDYLIIGQGLAGSIIAYQLLKRGKSIAIIDDRKVNTSSTVAVGLVNPFTGPKMVKSWKTEQITPFLEQFYKEAEQTTNTLFFTKRTIYRPFLSIEELNDWDGRSSQPDYKKFINKICSKNTHSSHIYDPYGGVEINGYVLNVRSFIGAFYQYLAANTIYIEERFDEERLEIMDSEIRYNEIKANKIIFCSGYQMQKSKYFEWLPLAPVKGEILHLKLQQNFKTIYNRSGFIIPQGNGLFMAGSTYNRSELTEKPTESGKNEITKKLEALLKVKYEIVKHEVGIRPGTKTRKPLVGIHPIHKRLITFNGLGTKGVSIAPYFGNQLVKCLEEGNILDEEVDIKKYYSLYFTQNNSTLNS